MRWLLQLGGRWLMSQVWRGVREGSPKDESVTARPTASSSTADGPQRSPEVLRQECTLGVVCGSRRLFDSVVESMTGKRTIEANRFRLVSGHLSGVPIVAVLPHEAAGGLSQTLAALCDGHHPQFVVSIGEAMSGGEAIREGELVVATEVVGPENQRLKLDGGSPDADWVHRGRVDSAPGLDGSPLAIDPWSWENAVGCRSVGVPLVAISAITKPSQERESPGARLLRPSGTMARRTGAFAGLAWRQPKELQRAWQLQTAAWQACDRAVKLIGYMAKASVSK